MSEDSANQTSSGRDVFVSYASQDAAVANTVVEHLEQHGIRCWIAPRDVKPGAQYADAIVRVLERLVVFCKRLFGLTMLHQHVTPGFQRIRPMRSALIRIFELRHCAHKIPVLGECDAPGVIPSGQIGRERNCLCVPLLPTLPVAPTIEDIAEEAVAIHERSS
jgi:TIR domain